MAKMTNYIEVVDKHGKIVISKMDIQQFSKSVVNNLRATNNSSIQEKIKVYNAKNEEGLIAKLVTEVNGKRIGENMKLNAKSILERYKTLKGIPLKEDKECCDKPECDCEPKAELNDSEEIEPGEPESVMEKLHLKDKILDEMTLEELVITCQSNEEGKDEETVRMVFNQLLDDKVAEARAVFKKELQNIVGELSESKNYEKDDKEVVLESREIPGKDYYFMEVRVVSQSAYENILKLDKKLVGTKDYMGVAYFWNTEYKHGLRDCTIDQRVDVHDAFLKAGLELDGESPQHEAIVKKIIKGF